LEWKEELERKINCFLSSTPQLAFYRISSNTGAVYSEDNARLLFSVVTSIILDNYHPHEWVLLDNEK